MSDAPQSGDGSPSAVPFPTAPIAASRPTVREFSGIPLADPYAWLEDPNDPAVIAHLEAENAYGEAVLAGTGGLRETLYREMLGRVRQSDETVPVRIGDWGYWTRTVAGSQYPILLRRAVAAPADRAPEQTLLDPNALVRTGYIKLLAWEPSPDGRYLAYTLNETGGIEGTLRVKDLETGQDLAETISPVSGWGGFAWANDSRTLFYLRQDAALKPAALLRHRLGADLAADALLYSEPDEVFSLSLSTAKDRSHLFLSSHSADTSEVRSLPADRADEPWTLFAARQPGIEYRLEHLGDDFLVLTNEDARDFKPLAAPVADPARANRRELVPHRPGRLLQGLDVFSRAIVLYGRQDGLPQIFVRDATTGDLGAVAFDDAVYAVRGDQNPSFDSPSVRYRYESFVTPRTVAELDLATGERTLLKRDEVLGGYDPTAYLSERLWATGADGARVPISLVRRRDGGGAAAGPQPTLLCGYGSYGYSYDPTFDPITDAYRPSLLDRGVAVAIAHVRGGEEMGRAWYEDGKLLKKTNSFTDFVACADHLVAAGRTSREQLVISGGSAGGLLMGAVVNLRPDLARAVLARVPFVDVVRVMLDPSLPLTVGEYREWGDPRVPVYRDAIAAYSPIENVAPAAYPEILATAGLNDHQVPYWQPVKWVARLRARATGGPFLLRINLGAGHGGASGRYDLLREIAHDQAFVLGALGLEGPPPAAP